MRNNLNLDLVKINGKAKFYQILSLFHKILSRSHKKKQGPNLVVNLRKLTRNNLNLVLVMVKAYAKSYKDPLVRSQDTERKRNFDNNQGP